MMAPPARLELTTLRLGGVRSILVSYGGIHTQFMLNYSTQFFVQCQEIPKVFLFTLRKRRQSFHSAAYIYNSSIRINSGNAVSNFTPYQWAGFRSVSVIAAHTKSAAIFTASNSVLSCIRAPAKQAANISPVP